MSFCLDLEHWDKASEIGLIVDFTGTGKTYSCINELPQMLDVVPSNVLILFPRVSIKEQCLRNYSDKCEEYPGEDESKVKLATCHLFGNKYKNGEKIPQPQIVIVDEWHTLFAENNFAEQLIYFEKLFQEWVRNPLVAVIAITATPLLPLKFVNECPFEGLDYIYKNIINMPCRIIHQGTEAVHQVSTVQIEQFKSLETILQACPADSRRKQIIFTSCNLEKLVQMANQDENAGWLCSKSTSRKMGGVSFAELMDKQLYDSVIAGKLPSDINRLYVTSGYREGININDELVQEIIIDGSTDIDIIQSLGRVRHSIKRLIIVIDSRKYLILENKVTKALKLLRSNDSGTIENYYKKQEVDNLPLLVYLANGQYQLNYLAFCYWIYCDYSLKCAKQKENVSLTWFDKQLPSRNEYFENILSPFTDKIQFNKIVPKYENIVQENKKKIEQFDWSSWCDKELYAATAKEFAENLNLKNKDYSTMAISGIYNKYPQLFESKKRRRIDGRREYVYKICPKFLTDL